MTGKASPVKMEQCADYDPHPAHPWGWRRRCSGVLDAEGLPTTQEELDMIRAAAFAEGVSACMAMDVPNPYVRKGRI
jgi:hypothetical protein